MIDTITLFGKSVSLYYLFWFFGLIAVLVLGYVTGKKYDLDFAKSILCVAGAVVLGYILLWGTSYLFGGGKMIGLNFVRIVTFLPLPVWVLAKLLRCSFGDIADFVAPLLAVFHGVTHLGCIFAGCCHGYPASWGLYSNVAEQICFPIQPIEGISSILVGVILLVMMKKDVQRGKLYAWYLALFGGTRFIWEFFRDNRKVWNGISELALHALAALMIGTMVLIICAWLNKRRLHHEKD